MHPDMWSYRESPEVADSSNLVGYDVEAIDGQIGSVDEATYEAGGSYLVVDTGGWIFGKKVMLPAGVSTASTMASARSSSAATATRSRQAPEFDEMLAARPGLPGPARGLYGRQLVGNPI